MPPTVFAMTITPKDGYQYFKSPDRLKRFVYTIQWLLLKKVPCGIPYELHLEVSRPPIMQDNQGRLHYHGTITLTDEQMIDYYIDWSRQLLQIGRIEMKPEKEQNLSGKRTWTEYKTKDKQLMEPICKRDGVTYILHEGMDRPKWGPQKSIGKNGMHELGLE